MLNDIPSYSSGNAMVDAHDRFERENAYKDRLMNDFNKEVKEFMQKDFNKTSINELKDLLYRLNDFCVDELEDDDALDTFLYILLRGIFGNGLADKIQRF